MISRTTHPNYDRARLAEEAAAMMDNAANELLVAVNELQHERNYLRRGDDLPEAMESYRNSTLASRAAEIRRAARMALAMLGEDES